MAHLLRHDFLVDRVGDGIQPRRGVDPPLLLCGSGFGAERVKEGWVGLLRLGAGVAEFWCFLESFLRVAFVQTCVYLALVHVNFVSHAAKCVFSP